MISGQNVFPQEGTVEHTNEPTTKSIIIHYLLNSPKKEH